MFKQKQRIKEVQDSDGKSLFYAQRRVLGIWFTKKRADDGLKGLNSVRACKHTLGYEAKAKVRIHPL